MLRTSKIYCDLRIVHRTFVKSGYVQNKLKYSKEAVISLKLWVPEMYFWKFRTCCVIAKVKQASILAYLNLSLVIDPLNPSHPLHTQESIFESW